MIGASRVDQEILYRLETFAVEGGRKDTSLHSWKNILKDRRGSIPQSKDG